MFAWKCHYLAFFCLRWKKIISVSIYQLETLCLGPIYLCLQEKLEFWTFGTSTVAQKWCFGIIFWPNFLVGDSSTPRIIVLIFLPSPKNSVFKSLMFVSTRVFLSGTGRYTEKVIKKRLIMVLGLKWPTLHDLCITQLKAIKLRENEEEKCP